MSLVVPILLSAAVLITSGIAKLGEPVASRDAFTALRLPDALAKSPAPALLPWGEIALGILLLSTSGPLLLAAALATTLLFVAYTVVIARALGFDEPVSCNCFGKLGNHAVSRRTLWRNVLLVVTGLLAMLAPLLDVSVWRAIAADAGGVLPWVAMAALTGAVAVLVLGGGPATEAAPVRASEAKAGDRVPFFTLRTPDGATHINSWDLERPTLLLFLSPGCGPCERVVRQVSDWAANSPDTDVRVVLSDSQVSQVETLVPEAVRPLTLLDPGGNVLAQSGAGTPSALLVGPSGAMLAPAASGQDSVTELAHSRYADASAVPVAEPEPPAPAPVAQVEAEDDLEDYVRLPIPTTLVLDGPKPLTLHELTAQKAQLLVSVTCLCGTSRDAVAAVAGYAERLPAIEVALLSRLRRDQLPLGEDSPTRVLYDHAGLTQMELDMHGSPQAILLGADGMIAGGPVQGFEEIEQFVADIEDALSEAEVPGEVEPDEQD